MHHPWLQGGGRKRAANLVLPHEAVLSRAVVYTTHAGREELTQVRERFGLLHARKSSLSSLRPRCAFSSSSFEIVQHDDEAVRSQTVVKRLTLATSSTHAGSRACNGSFCVRCFVRDSSEAPGVTHSGRHTNVSGTKTDRYVYRSGRAQNALNTR